MCSKIGVALKQLIKMDKQAVFPLAQRQPHKHVLHLITGKRRKARELFARTPHPHAAAGTKPKGIFTIMRRDNIGGQPALDVKGRARKPEKETMPLSPLSAM
jgi:hypothetical protein